MFESIEEYEPGESCANCWGPGKTFGDNPTPKRVYVTGSGFAGGCAPCNNTFIFEQNPINDCQWLYNDGTVAGNWTITAANTTFFLRVIGFGDCYNRLEGPCKKVSTFGGATVSVDIAQPQTPEYDIAVDKNFAPSPNTVFLNLGPTNGDEVLILARRLDRIKLHVKYTPEY